MRVTFIHLRERNSAGLFNCECVNFENHQIRCHIFGKLEILMFNKKGMLPWNLLPLSVIPDLSELRDSEF